MIPFTKFPLQNKTSQSWEICPFQETCLPQAVHYLLRGQRRDFTHPSLTSTVKIFRHLEESKASRNKPPTGPAPKALFPTDNSNQSHQALSVWMFRVLQEFGVSVSHRNSLNPHGNGPQQLLPFRLKYIIMPFVLTRKLSEGAHATRPHSPARKKQTRT